MNSRRSYLESLNAGRQRKSYVSLDELNRSLPNRENAQSDFGDAETDDIVQRMEHLSRAISGAVHEADLREKEERVPRQSAAEALARTIEHARSQEAGVEAVGRIARELQVLRQELREQMTSGLKEEFESLRRDIDNASKGSPAIAGRDLNQEIEKLFAAINDLGEKSDDAAVDNLRLEIGKMREAFDSLAREETVKSVGRKWDDFDRRFGAVEDHLAASPVNGAALNGLVERLEQINAAVNMLPQSLSMESLEDKVRSLAKAVERFLLQHDGKSPSTFEAIEERLDEISRAIVASTSRHHPATVDPQPFERIEARITSLARQLEELVDARPIGAVMDQLQTLSARVDEIAERAELPQKAVENLATQIALISEKLDQGKSLPDAEQILQDMENRFTSLSQALERRQADAREDSLALFKDLEQRLERYNAMAQASSESIVQALDGRFDDLAGKLAARAEKAPDLRAIGDLEARLDAISGRMEAATSKIKGIDPDLVRQLKNQVAGLTQYLDRPGTKLPEFEDIGPRLAMIEKSLSESRENIVHAARQVAEEALRNGGTKPDMEAISELAGDLQSLEELTRRSDERNTRTFEAIHDTLLKIVERLGTLESGIVDAPKTPVSEKRALTDVPPIDPDETEFFLESGEPGPPLESVGERPSGRTAATAAAEAAAAAVDADTKEQPAAEARSRSMFVGLARTLRKKKPEAAPAARSEPNIASEEESAATDLDEPIDPKLANRPIEPGSGAPDLNAIMKRVRDERGQGAKAIDADAAKADFIAAARRAAQAAASEAEVLKKNSAPKSAGGRLNLRNLLRANSKTIMLTAGAVLIALAALELGKAFMHDNQSAHLAMATPSAAIKHSAIPADKAPSSKPANTTTVAAAMTPKPMSPMASTDGAMNVTAGKPGAAATPQAEAPAVAKPRASDAPVIQQASNPPNPVPAVSQPTATANTVTAASLASAPAASSLVSGDQAVVSASIGPAALRDAAKAGDPRAMFEIATRYAEGSGVKQDMKEAAQWYQKAASLGLAPAEYRIGNFYEKGMGVATDVTKAEDWYQKAAEAGNASAMHNLAVLYAMGADGKTNNEAAARWFTAAAELGVKDSQFNLGILSAKGVGVPQNLEESYKWFALVAKTGDRDAAAKRDDVAKALRPEQLAKAKQMVELWKSKQIDEAANVVDVPDGWKDKPLTTSSVDMKKAVRTIQLILNKNGYDAGQADGVMGDKTKVAIAKFQKENGMQPTGEVDEKLVRILLAKK